MATPAPSDASLTSAEHDAVTGLSHEPSPPEPQSTSGQRIRLLLAIGGGALILCLIVVGILVSGRGNKATATATPAPAPTTASGGNGQTVVAILPPTATTTPVATATPIVITATPVIITATPIIVTATPVSTPAPGASPTPAPIPTATVAATPVVTATVPPTAPPSTLPPPAPTILPTITAVATSTTPPTAAATTTPAPTVPVTPTPSFPGQIWIAPNGLLRLKYPNTWIETHPTNAPANSLVTFQGPDAISLSISVFDQTGSPADELQAIKTMRQASTDAIWSFDAATDVVIGGEPGQSISYTVTRKDPATGQPINGQTVTGTLWVVNHAGQRYNFEAVNIGNQAADVEMILATVVFGG